MYELVKIKNNMLKQSCLSGTGVDKSPF